MAWRGPESDGMSGRCQRVAAAHGRNEEGGREGRLVRLHRLNCQSYLLPGLAQGDKKLLVPVRLGLIKE